MERYPASAVSLIYWLSQVFQQSHVNMDWESIEVIEWVSIDTVLGKRYQTDLLVH